MFIYTSAMRKLCYISCTDSELIGLLMEDDHKAYMAIYERYSRHLYRQACQKWNNRDEVKDLLQDIFTALWLNRSSLSPDTPLAGYLYATLRYSIIKLITHKKLEAVYSESPAAFPTNDSTAADDLVREKDLRKLIEEEIVQLPKKMQEVFRMSRYSHLSHREIADRLDLSEATVKKHVNNALKVLRSKLGALLSFIFFFFL